MNISVCIATYNGERYIKEQLESILMQLGDDAEVIISDDGSTDSTLDIIRFLNDRRIKIFENKNRKGFVSNFENALRQASGKYIFLSDQDDYWLPDKVNVLLKHLENYLLVCSNGKLADENLNVFDESFFEHLNAGIGIVKNFLKIRYYGFGMAFRKELLDYALPFPKQKYVGHDMMLGVLADYMKGSIFEWTPLTLYRRHGNNISTVRLDKKSILYNLLNLRKLVRLIYSRIITFYVFIILYIRVVSIGRQKRFNNFNN